MLFRSRLNSVKFITSSRRGEVNEQHQIGSMREIMGKANQNKEDNETPPLRVSRAETRLTVYRPFAIIRMQSNRALLVLEPICNFSQTFCNMRSQKKRN